MHDRRRPLGAPKRPLRALAAPLVALLAAFWAAGAGAADDEPKPDDINARLYQQLGHSDSAGKIETVSGQMFIRQKNIDSAVISDALAEMLDAQQGGNAKVAVHNRSRLNFEIHFEKNSADLTPDSQQGLDELGQVLVSEHLDRRFLLGGHTDLDGDAAVNGPLSQARAESARAYLLEKHAIEPQRLVAKGFGTQEPLHAVEKKPEDKLYNRRVDLRPID